MYSQARSVQQDNFSDISELSKVPKRHTQVTNGTHTKGKKGHTEGRERTHGREHMEWIPRREQGRQGNCTLTSDGIENL